MVLSSRRVLGIAFSSFIFVIFATSANAGFLCSINPWCKEEVPSGSDLRSPEDLASDDTIADQSVADKVANTSFRFFKLTGQNVGTGYVRVEYDFVGRKIAGSPNETYYGDADGNSIDLFKQSILDWARTLFVKDKRTYVVTLSARSKASGELFWTEPIVSFEYENGFNIKKISDSFRFNGSSTFYRPFDDEIEVGLDILHAKTSDIDVKLIGELFDVAGKLSSLLGGPAFSVVDVMASATYRNTIDDLKAKLAQFQVSKALSRKAVLKYENDRWIGFQYYFRAPNVPSYPFKLNVTLAYKNSLLDQRVVRQPNGGAVLESAQILTLPVKPKASTSVQSLREYFASNPISSDVQAILASPAGLGVSACSKLTQAASDILQPNDVSLAKLAYVLDSLDKFATKKSPDCFQESEKVHLADYHLKLPPGFDQGGGSSGGQLLKLRPIEKYFNRYLVALSILIKYGEDQRDAIQSSITEFVGQAKDGDDERPFRVNDQSSLFVSGGPRQIFPTDMVNALLLKKFDQAGCFERSIYSDNDADPNVVGVLFAKGPDAYEAVVHFDKQPVADPQPNQIKVDLMEIRPLTDDVRRLYEKAYNSKACRSGWNPWKKGT